MKRLFFFLLLFSASSVRSQTPAFPTSGEIYLALQKLNVLGSVLYIAAHPDDENTRLLTYFSKEKLYRTGYLSLTRGDGGQNLIGEEQGVELGLIRTQELLAARRIDGAEQFFTRAYDFGFSKSPEETFAKWDRENILSDVVWVIRKFRPDVIITRFPTTGEGGHGHHTASAILAAEAFNAAADAKRFPEQLKWVLPWHAKRILWNGFNFGSSTPPAGMSFSLDAGAFNPLLGKSYGEIAAESRSQHKSQGFGVPRGRGEAKEYFRLTGGDALNTDLFEGIATDWTKVARSERVRDAVAQAIASFDFLSPQKSLPALVAVHRALKELPVAYWQQQKLKETQSLIEAASGLWAEAVSTTQYAVQGDSLRINFVLNDRSGSGIRVKKLGMGRFDTIPVVPSVALKKNENFVVSKTLFVPHDGPLTQPYWLKETMKDGYFQVSDQALIGEPDVQPAYTAAFTLDIGGEEFSIIKPVRYKFADPVKGEIYQPVTVIPAATVMMTPSVVLLRNNESTTKPIGLQVNANRLLRGTAEPHIRGNRFDSTLRDTTFVLEKAGNKNYLFTLSTQLSGTTVADNSYGSIDVRNGEIVLSPRSGFPGKVDNVYGSVQLTEGTGEQTAYLSMRRIDYDHIPAVRYFYPDAVKVLTLSLKTAGQKVGYIVGAGDNVPLALQQMGFDVVVLSEKELSAADLKTFDAVITGVRAYNANDWMNAHYDKLMKYVEGGGNLIVQYNTSSQIGPVKARIGPQPFTISRARITDENAAVTFLKPEHPVLTFPNKITQDDFKGWVQERSIYHAEGWASAYEPLLRMADAGEAPHDGSLIVARHGKGWFTYTGLVFFRELPAGVPGAYRLLANLIALNKIKPS